MARHGETDVALPIRDGVAETGTDQPYGTARSASDWISPVLPARAIRFHSASNAVAMTPNAVISP
jgi:hypothetical protein